MRFRLGTMPESPEFLPEADGWRLAREPSPPVTLLCALPISAVLLLGLGIAWSGVARLAGVSGEMRFGLLTVAGVFLVIVPLHELVHAVCHPGRGGAAASVLGFWPRLFVPYAYYDDEMSRNRFLLVMVAPFLVLSPAPLLVTAVFAVTPAFLVTLSAVNALGSSVDLLGFALLGLQAPSSARVRNKGPRTWWRDAA